MHIITTWTYFKIYLCWRRTCRDSVLTGLGWSIIYFESFPRDTIVELGLGPISLKLPSVFQQWWVVLSLGSHRSIHNSDSICHAVLYYIYLCISLLDLHVETSQKQKLLIGYLYGLGRADRLCAPCCSPRRGGCGP